MNVGQMIRVGQREHSVAKLTLNLQDADHVSLENLHGYRGWAIVKKDIRSLDDYHAIEVAKLVYEDDSFHNSLDGKEYVRCMMNEVRGILTAFSCVKVYQYLNAVGYAMPVTLIGENGDPYTYTANLLVDLGVYKIVE